MTKRLRYISSLISFFIIVACSNEEKKPMSAKTITSTFDTQGHRGSRGLMPENTWPAMKKALELGVTTLEMDVVITKDKKVVLSHEPFFNHEISTKPDGSLVTEAEEKQLNIYQLDYATVATYDVGLRPHPRFPQQQKIAVNKPLLATILDSVIAYTKATNRAFPFFNIETKSNSATDAIYHPAPGEFIDLLMQVILDKKMEAYTIIQSFDIRTLQYLHQHYPSIATALLIEGYDKENPATHIKQLGFTPTIYSPAYELVTIEMINFCHAQGCKIIPWTVNDKPTIDSLQSLGVDGIISDYPNLFAQ